jgi:hypothetical protein
MNDSLFNAHLFFMITHDLISLVVLGAGAYMLYRSLPAQEPARPSGTGVFRTEKDATGKIKLVPVTDAAPQPGQTHDEALENWLTMGAS